MELPKKLNDFMIRDRNINYKSKKIVKYEEYKNGKYSSDAGWFDIKSYWILNTDIHYFFTETLLKNIFIKGEKILFLVHPESETFYKEFLNNKEPGPILKGLATSSQRTVLTFYENTYFFAKLSLDIYIGGANRTIPKGEVVRSIGTNIILNKIKLPMDFKYFPEVLSAIPKNFERGGMIIREIPDFMYKYDIFPLFSLFTENENGKYIMKYNYLKWIDTFIYNFIKQYLELCANGISTESHSQNLLVALESEKILFLIYRDFGGFNIDLKHIEKKYGKIELPYLTSIEEEYHQKLHIKSLQECLSVYFRYGILETFADSVNISFEETEKKIEKYLKYILVNIYKIRIGEIGENYQIMEYVEKKIKK